MGKRQPDTWVLKGWKSKLMSFPGTSCSCRSGVGRGKPRKKAVKWLTNHPPICSLLTLREFPRQQRVNSKNTCFQPAWQGCWESRGTLPQHPLLPGLGIATTARLGPKHLLSLFYPHMLFGSWAENTGSAFAPSREAIKGFLQG